MIPEGKYKARATECVFNQDDKGRPQAIIRFDILDGEAAGDTITTYRYFNGGAADFSIKALDAIGCRMEGGDVTDIEGMGVECELVIEHEEYNGKWSAKVKYINKLRGPLVENMDATAKKSFAESMKAQVLAIREGSKSKGAPTTTAARPRAEGRPSASRPTATRHAGRAAVVDAEFENQPDDSFFGDDIPY